MFSVKACSQPNANMLLLTLSMCGGLRIVT